MKKKAKIESEPEEEKVVSLKRVGIAFIICIMLVGSVIRLLTWASETLINAGQGVLGASPSDIPEPVRLPEPSDIQYLTDHATELIGTISFDSITSSQSATQHLIKKLQELQAADTGIEDIYCKYMCDR